MKRFKNILFAVTQEKIEIPVLKAALALAKENDAKLEIYFAFKSLPPNAVYKEAVLEEAKKTLEQHAGEVLARSIPVSIHEGDPFIIIIQKVLRDGHDIVFKASRSKEELKFAFFSTIDMHLLRKCPVPLWLQKKDQDFSHINILAAIDPDQKAPQDDMLTHMTLNLGSSVKARHQSAELHVLHCWEAEFERTLRNSALMRISDEELAQHVGAYEREALDAFNAALEPFAQSVDEAHKHFIKADPKSFIPSFIKEKEIDLLVMGTLARTGIPGILIGNMAETILHQIDCSILALKPPGFKTPVKP